MLGVLVLLAVAKVTSIVKSLTLGLDYKVMIAGVRKRRLGCWLEIRKWRKTTKSIEVFA